MLARFPPDKWIVGICEDEAIYLYTGCPRKILSDHKRKIERAKENYK